ncbi:hypothetical protein GCM10008119_04440 [Pedobacter mendelii]|uniref:Tetratricopeptide repeat protein n=2 Tax=Pedobacter mendelii TaxID=1908240 RepID=A0ABQ2BEK3_9SPHI|nr:hypothetical protein GCM10008119_04440 [Pedobacter mendelii]
MTSSARDNILNRQIIKILDSATIIEPTYNSAYSNKLRPLLSLKKYNSAISVVNRMILNNPEDLNSYIKLGVIYESYLKKRNLAIPYYKKSYDLALKNVAQHRRKNSYYDEVVAYMLMFYKGKVVAIEYLNKISSYYSDTKSKKQIEALQKLIESFMDDSESKKNVFNSISTL